MALITVIILSSLAAITTSAATTNATAAFTTAAAAFATARAAAFTTTTTSNELVDLASARKLINSASWGVVSSPNSTDNSAPFGGVLSYSDGGRGTPFFYLTPVDRATAVFARSDPRASLTVSQLAVDGCPGYDPQEPPCAKITLSGELKKLDPDSDQGRVAKAALFTRHPSFQKVPKFAKFKFYELKISAIYLINSYLDSPKYLSVGGYLNITM